MNINNQISSQKSAQGKLLFQVFLCFLHLFLRVSFAVIADQNAQTLRHLYNLNPDGSYNYAFETDNGILAEQQGFLEEEASQKVVGQYQYTSPEGTVIHLVYSAGKDGFQPSGSHLPITPEIPVLIRKSLEYLRSKGKL